MASPEDHTVETMAETHHEAAPTGIAALGIDGSLLVTQAVNFLLLLLILRVVVYRPLLALLEKRRVAIAESLERAEKARRDSEESEARIRAELVEARAEATKLVAEARTHAETLAGQLKEKAEQDALHLLNEARAQIAREKATLRAEVEIELGDLVAQAAERVIGAKRVSFDEADIQEALRAVKEEA